MALMKTVTVASKPTKNCGNGFKVDVAELLSQLIKIGSGNVVSNNIVKTVINALSRFAWKPMRSKFIRDVNKSFIC